MAVVKVKTQAEIRTLWKELTKNGPVWFYYGMRGPKRSKSWRLKYAQLHRWMAKRAKLKNESITLSSDGQVTFEEK